MRKTRTKEQSDTLTNPPPRARNRHPHGRGKASLPEQRWLRSGGELWFSSVAEKAPSSSLSEAMRMGDGTIMSIFGCVRLALPGLSPLSGPVPGRMLASCTDASSRCLGLGHGRSDAPSIIDTGEAFGDAANFRLRAGENLLLPGAGHRSLSWMPLALEHGEAEDTGVLGCWHTSTLSAFTRGCRRFAGTAADGDGGGRMAAGGRGVQRAAMRGASTSVAKSIVARATGCRAGRISAGCAKRTTMPMVRELRDNQWKALMRAHQAFGAMEDPCSPLPEHVGRVSGYSRSSPEVGLWRVEQATGAAA
jgi:hypothetical protein